MKFLYIEIRIQLLLRLREWKMLEFDTNYRNQVFFFKDFVKKNIDLDKILKMPFFSGIIFVFLILHLDTEYFHENDVELGKFETLGQRSRGALPDDDRDEEGRVREGNAPLASQGDQRTQSHVRWGGHLGLKESTPHLCCFKLRLLFSISGNLTNLLVFFSQHNFVFKVGGELSK